MNKFYLLGLAAFSSWLACCTHAVAQQEPTPPPPQPPYVNNAPAYAAWNIAFSTKQTNPAPRTLKAVRVNKMNKDFQEIKYWSDGSTSEQWQVQGVILIKEPYSPGIYVISSEEILLPSNRDLCYRSSSDFPELNWLSANTYAGVKNFQGKTCYWFQTDAKSSTDSTSAAPIRNTPIADGKPSQQAWVDAKTLLPVAFDEGGMLRVYSFESATSQQAELPPHFAEALKDYQKQAMEPLRHAMPPLRHAMPQ